MNEKLAPRQAEGRAPSVVTHSSIWSLVLVNAVALGVALAAGWSLADLMPVYWIQNVIVGTSYFARILGLEKFSAANFYLADRSVERLPATKRQTAFFFLAHFGAFHLGYLVFIASEYPGVLHAGLGLATCGIAFGINDYLSHRYYRELDRQGTPNVVRLMFTPYMRLIPMHLAVVFGAVALDSAEGLLFVVLKTVADVVMHYVEQRAPAEEREADVYPRR